MTDLWDPVTRAEKCASCHVGNADEQKVVTHAMYAAGHPPLPALEVATFSDAQPRHWQYLREKPPAVQEKLGFKTLKPEQTELAVVSGIVVFRESMKLFAAQARNNGLIKEPETSWPDFARFDCYACHHDLQIPSWRQARGYGGRAPGRPLTPAWPTALVRLGMVVADPTGQAGFDTQFVKTLGAFQKTTSWRPFGDPKQSADAAAACADWAGLVSARIHGMVEDPRIVVVDKGMTERLLRELCKIAVDEPVDYDTARQIAMAFRTIYTEARAMDENAFPDPALAAILSGLDQKAHLGLPTANGLDMMVGSLRVKLPAAPLSLPSAGTLEPVEKTFEARLRSVLDFDLDEFRAQFAELAKHL
jgi:hypothetical protein